MRLILLLCTIAWYALPGWADKFVYDGKVEIAVQGLEFRGAKSYPEDTIGEGIVSNANNDLKTYCSELESELRKNLGGAFLAAECSKGWNVAKRSDRRQYRAILSVESTVEALKVLPGEKLDGGKFIASDFANSPYKWQAARQAARDGFDVACEEFKNQALLTYGPRIIFADCGLVKETGSSDGWNYYSRSQLILSFDKANIPSCTNGRYQDELWWDTIADDVVVSVDCEFGGNKKQVYDRLVERVCDGQLVRDTGEKQRGAFKKTIGSCAPPAGCGANAHNSVWWVNAGRIREPQHCPHGGNKVNVYERLERKSCYNGNVTTGVSRRGSFIRTRGSCHPAPKSCGPHSHGSTWWVNSGRIREAAYCPHGGNRVDVYQEETKMRCRDGNRINTGRTRRGSFIRTRGQCKPRPTPPRINPPRVKPRPPRARPPRAKPPRTQPRPPRARPPRAKPPRTQPRPPRARPPRAKPPRTQPRPPRARPPRAKPNKPNRGGGRRGAARGNRNRGSR